MKQARRSFLIAALVALLATPGFATVGKAATDQVIDEGWVPVRTTQTGGHQAVRFRDVPEYNERVSALLARMPEWKTCTSITTAPCSTAPDITFSAVLQPCSSATQLDCVVEFGTEDADGVRTPAVYATPFPETSVNAYAAEPSVGLPAGGPGGLWTVAASSGATIRTHYVGAMVSGSARPGERVRFEKFYTTVAPVAITPFDCEGANALEADCAPAFKRAGDGPNPDEVGYVDGYGRDQGLDCVMSGNADVGTQKAECALRKAISQDITYYVTVRLSQAVSGWMHGRMAEPNISIEDIADTEGAITLSVAAKPVSVPAVDIEKEFTDLPATLQEAYRETGGWKGAGASGYGNFAFETDPLVRNKESMPTPYGDTSIEELEAWLPVVNDTAVADLSTWAVRTLGPNDLGAAEGCVTERNKVAGIVSTNATVYKAAAPVYDPESGALLYTVAAPHYKSSNELFKGAYSLIIRSDIARCIYNFTSAPITSTIEVIDTGGETSTAVTTVSEKDGWIKLSASGFTHSTPTIRAKMTQEKKTTTETPGTGNTPTTPAATPGTGNAPTTPAPSQVTDTVAAPPQATPTAPQVGKGRKVARSQLLKWAGVKVTGKSRVTVTATKKSKKVCAVSGTSVRAKATGTCTVSVRVQTGSKRTTKTVKFLVT